VIVVFDKSFSKSLGKLKDSTVLNNLESIIFFCESAKNIKTIPNLKKLKGYRNYYRIKSGPYRIGLEIEQDTIRFITVLHRKDIYKKFP